MLTPTAICDQYAWIYTSLPIPAGTWDHIIPVDGAYAAIKRVNNIDYVMFRGSTTFMDWRQDFEDAALPIDDDLLGPVHPGFRAGVLLIKDLIDALVGPDVVIVGHSLGAGHAAIYGGYRMASGNLVTAMVLFGEPKAGGPQLADLLSTVPVQSFRNANADGHDLITDVPFSDPPQLPYRHVREPLTDCRHDPSPLDPWLVFKYHHMGHYCRAFGCGTPQALSLPI